MTAITWPIYFLQSYIIKRLCVFMFQTWNNSQLLRRVLWISAELTIVSSLKHKNTQPLYIFIRVRVLHLDRLKERNWLYSFVTNWGESISGRFYRFEASVQRTCRPTWRHAEWPNFSEQEVNQPCDEEQHTYIKELRGQ